MKFSIQAKRDFIGHRIDVTVSADEGETITRVTTLYDDFPLADDPLDPPQVQYQRTFSQVGGFTPGDDHIVKVTAYAASGSQRTASYQWQD